MNPMPHYTETAAEVAQAHELLAEGKREEAFRLVGSILKEHPQCPSALALRDRLNSEECTLSLSQILPAIGEQEDYSPLLPLGLLLMSVFCGIIGTFLLFKPVQKAGEMGMTAQVAVGENMIHATQQPVHFLFWIPCVFFLLAVVSFVGYRRFRV